MKLVKEQEIDIVLNYSREEDSGIDFTYSELNYYVKCITDWTNIKLEPEKYLPTLRYDMYATRVLIDDCFIGYIDRVNSPIVSLWRDFELVNQLKLEYEATPLYKENGDIERIVLNIYIYADTEEFTNLVKNTNLVNKHETNN